MCPEGVFFIGPEHDGHTGLRSDEQVRTRAIADSLPANQPTVCVNGRIPGLKAEYRQRTRCPQVVGESLWKHSLHESSIAPFLPKSSQTTPLSPAMRTMRGSKRASLRTRSAWAFITNSMSL